MKTSSHVPAAPFRTQRMVGWVSQKKVPRSWAITRRC